MVDPIKIIEQKHYYRISSHNDTHLGYLWKNGEASASFKNSFPLEYFDLWDKRIKSIWLKLKIKKV